MANIIGPLTGLSDPYDIYINYNRSATPIPISYYFTFANNEQIGLYYQVVTTVTLASGSTAVISGETQNLGEIASGGNSNNIIQIANITTNPSTDEVETIAVKVNRYTDSGYTSLYDSVNMPQNINLHLFSDALTSLSTVIETDNFAGGSGQGWGINNPYSNGDGMTTSTYYDATSGYSMYYSTYYPENFPYNSNNGWFGKNFAAVSTTYTDALISVYVKVAATELVGVQITIGTTNYYYIANVTNTTNWFGITVHIPVNQAFTIQVGNITFRGSPASNSNIYLGYVQLIGKLSGSF